MLSYIVVIYKTLGTFVVHLVLYTQSYMPTKRHIPADIQENYC